MHYEKKINVMRSNVQHPSYDWCKEAYENADVIIWVNNRHYYRMNEGNDTSAYFVCVIPTNTNVSFHCLRINNVNYNIDYYFNIINYSQTK